MTHEHAWRAAILEVNAARLHFESVMRLDAVDDPEFNQAWLRLWRAERRRNELLVSSG